MGDIARDSGQHAREPVKGYETRVGSPLGSACSRIAVPSRRTTSRGPSPDCRPRVPSRQSGRIHGRMLLAWLSSAPYQGHAQFWAQKVERNMQRDRDTDTRLAAAGWLPVRVWEHEDPIEAARRVVDLVRMRSPRPTRVVPPSQG